MSARLNLDGAPSSAMVVHGGRSIAAVDGEWEMDPVVLEIVLEKGRVAVAKQERIRKKAEAMLAKMRDLLDRLEARSQNSVDRFTRR